jgi:hypothetical protein
MLQPQPAPSRQHQPSPLPLDGEGSTGALPPEIPREALEQCALFQRVLANPDFLDWLRWQHDRAIQALSVIPAASDRDRDKTVLFAKWEQIREIPREMRDFVSKIEQDMRERKERAEAIQKGEPPSMPAD